MYLSLGHKVLSVLHDSLKVLLFLQGVFGLLAIPASLVVLVGILLRESQVRNFAYGRVSIFFASSALIFQFFPVYIEMLEIEIR